MAKNDISWKGFQSLKHKFKSLPVAAAGRVSKASVREGSKEFSNRIKMNLGKRKVLKAKVRNELTGRLNRTGAIEAVTRTGALRKSIGMKVKRYRLSGVTVGIIGPRMGFGVDIVLPNRKTRRHDPVNIAHLVEYGHGGKAPAPPYPFMRPAFQTGKDEVRQVVMKKMRDGIIKEAQKVVAGKR